MDVTPRRPDDLDLRPRPAPPGRARRWWAFVVIAAVLIGLAFVATRALSDAALFFYNADEAVERRDQLGDDRFRLQGLVSAGTIEDTGDGVAFVVVYNGVEVPVAHRGDPPELFAEGMPVVLEGRWAPDRQTFASDRMLIKHDEQYDEGNPDRVKAAAEGGTTTVAPAPLP